MANQQPRLVNKQYNSPIGLYSDQNIRDVIERESQLLTNGAVGINFYNPSATTPSNLKNSAVMRLIQEQQNDQTRLKRVAWPPPSSEEHLVEVPPEQAVKSQNIASGPSNYAYQSNPQSGYSTTAAQQGFANNYQQPNYQQPTYYQQQQQPGAFSPVQNQSPSRYSPVQPAKQWSSVPSPTPQAQPKQWSFASSPTVQQSPRPWSTGTPQSPAPQGGFQPSYQSPGAQSYQYGPPSFPKEQELQQQRLAQARPYSSQPQKQFEPPPATITLRQEAPMSQAPAPVYNAQPATKVFRGGKYLRGDLKWPPPEVKKQMEEEQKHLEELAKGPAVKPRKVAKDYSEFFAQNALNSYYPGYKIPPGTQYYPHEPKYIKLS